LEEAVKSFSASRRLYSLQLDLTASGGSRLSATLQDIHEKYKENPLRDRGIMGKHEYE
jgi:hypothetical protein